MEVWLFGHPEMHQITGEIGYRCWLLGACITVRTWHDIKKNWALWFEECMPLCLCVLCCIGNVCSTGDVWPSFLCNSLILGPRFSWIYIKKENSSQMSEDTKSMRLSVFCWLSSSYTCSQPLSWVILSLSQVFSCQSPLCAKSRIY